MQDHRCHDGPIIRVAPGDRHLSPGRPAQAGGAAMPRARRRVTADSRRIYSNLKLFAVCRRVRPGPGQQSPTPPTIRLACPQHTDRRQCGGGGGTHRWVRVRIRGRGDIMGPPKGDGLEAWPLQQADSTPASQGVGAGYWRCGWEPRGAEGWRPGKGCPAQQRGLSRQR